MSAKSAKTDTFPTLVRNRWFNTANCRTIEFTEDLCKQEFKSECDINVIFSRYQESTPPTWSNPPVLTYGDFAEAPDFLDAQLLVKAAEEQFLSLPVKLRDRFQHDPARFLDFVHDRANLDEAKALGLLKAEDPPVPPPPPKVTP